MKFWYEMLEKGGFNDGAAVPAEAIEVRKVYVAVVNKIAEQLGSNHRAFEFNHGGSHNYCRVVIADKKYADKTLYEPSDRQELGVDFSFRNVQTRECEEPQDDDINQPDQAMMNAIGVANGAEVDLDSWVETTVVIDPAFFTSVDQIAKEAIDAAGNEI